MKFWFPDSSNGQDPGGGAGERVFESLIGSANYDNMGKTSRQYGRIADRRVTRQPEGLDLKSSECACDIVLQAVQYYTGQQILNGNIQSRKKEVVFARQLAQYFMTINRDIAYQDIGNITGKDHATIITSTRRIEGFIDIYPDVRETVITIGGFIKWLNQLDMEIVQTEVGKDRIRYFYFLLDQLGIRHLKEDLVQDASDGRTVSVRELKKLEMDNLVSHLENKLKDAREAATPKKQTVVKMDRMRKRILSICYSIGWTRFDPSTGKHSIDMERLEAWLDKYGYLHKGLNEYTYLELPTLITQFERLLKSTLSRVKSE